MAPRQSLWSRLTAPSVQPSPTSQPAAADGTVQLPAAEHLAAMPTWERFQKSPHYPVVITQDPLAVGQAINGSTDPAQPIPVNQETLEFDSEFFQGRMILLMKGLPTTPQHFVEEKRCAQVIIQGRWKESVPVDALWVGQCMLRPITVPPSLLSLVLHTAAKMFSSTCRVNVDPSSPSYLNPLLAACQTVHVAAPGEEAPDLLEVTEDCRLLGPMFTDKHGEPLSSEKRRKLFDTPSATAGIQLTPDHVFTFSMHQSIVDFSTYQLSMRGWWTMDMLQYLQGHPLQLMLLNTQADKRVFSLLVWHERMIYPDGAPSLQQQQHQASARALQKQALVEPVKQEGIKPVVIAATEPESDSSSQSESDASSMEDALEYSSTDDCSSDSSADADNSTGASSRSSSMESLQEACDQLRI